MATYQKEICQAARCEAKATCAPPSSECNTLPICPRLATLITPLSRSCRVRDVAFPTTSCRARTCPILPFASSDTLFKARSGPRQISLGGKLSFAFDDLLGAWSALRTMTRVYACGVRNVRISSCQTLGLVSMTARHAWQRLVSD